MNFKVDDFEYEKHTILQVAYFMVHLKYSHTHDKK
jgi:hypothetical protein